MAEYIDRETALNAFNGKIKLSDACLPFVKEYLQGVHDRIKAIPSADVVERKHGKWIENKEESEKHIEPIFICSACENMEAWGYIEKNTYNFCPHCGADMSEAENEDD